VFTCSFHRLGNANVSYIASEIASAGPLSTIGDESASGSLILPAAVCAHAPEVRFSVCCPAAEVRLEAALNDPCCQILSMIGNTVGFQVVTDSVLAAVCAHARGAR
jgi:hypothetical protein